MTIRTKAFLKDEFEAGTTVTSTMMGDAIDSMMQLPVMAIASAAENGAMGIVRIVSTASASLEANGAFGLTMLSTETTAGANDILQNYAAPSNVFGDWQLIAHTSIMTTVASVVFDDGIDGLQKYSTYKLVITRLRSTIAARDNIMVEFSFNSGASYNVDVLGSVRYSFTGYSGEFQTTSFTGFGTSVTEEERLHLSEYSANLSAGGAAGRSYHSHIITIQHPVCALSTAVSNFHIAAQGIVAFRGGTAERGCLAVMRGRRASVCAGTPTIGEPEWPTAIRIRSNVTTLAQGTISLYGIRD